SPPPSRTARRPRWPGSTRSRMPPASSPRARAMRPGTRRSSRGSPSPTPPPDPAASTGAPRTTAPEALPPPSPGRDREQGAPVKGFLDRYGAPLLMILPSILLIGVFVYGLLGVNFWTSMTDNHTAGQASGRQPTAFVGLTNYIELLLTEDFRHSLVNLVLFTATFLVGAMAMGFVWAWLLERPLRGGRLFQTIYLFPMAVSFVASGVVWRWLLNSNQGESASGLNRLFQMVGLGFLQNPWWNNITFGIMAIALPAVWQLSG